MESHALFVWERYVIPSRFKKLYIVAHSAGGACLASIQKNFGNKSINHLLAHEFYSRTQKVALTDSWTINKENLDKEQKAWMFKNCIHYLASSEPLGTLLTRNKKYDVCP